VRPRGIEGFGRPGDNRNLLPAKAKDWTGRPLNAEGYQAAYFVARIPCGIRRGAIASW